MALFSFSSNVDSDKFYTSKYGAGTISVDDNYVYSLKSIGTTDREAYVRIDIKNLNIGDLITIEYDADAVGEISELLMYTNPNNNVTSSREKRSKNISGIYYGKSTFVAHKKGDFSISVGAGWATNLEGTIKNISVSVESNSAYAVADSPTFQLFTIATVATGRFILRDDWSRNEGTLTVLSDETLKLVPAKKPKYRYQVFINSIYGGASSNYIVRGDVDLQNNVTFRVYNVLTNEVVKLADVKSLLYFGVFLV